MIVSTRSAVAVVGGAWGLLAVFLLARRRRGEPLWLVAAAVAASGAAGVV
jgi:hypothetical protein